MLYDNKTETTDENEGESKYTSEVSTADLLKYHRRWINELKAAKKELKDWHKQGGEINDKYLDKRKDSDKRNHKYNLFNSNTKILCDALFARIPKPDVSRRFKDPGDEIGRVGSNILQRVISTELETDEYFTDTAKNIIKDFVIPGGGFGWVRYKNKQENPEVEEIQLTDDANEELADADNPSPIITDEDTPIEHVLWSDILYSPCRTWKECRWIARGVDMSEEEVEERFGEEHADKLFKDVREDSDAVQKPNNEQESKNNIISTVRIWEIWCKTSKHLYFICEEADTCLDCKEDPLGLPHFFPTAKPLLGTTTTSNMVPVPDYVLVQDQYEELNTLNSRISNLVRSCKIAGAYDKKSKELAQILSPNSPETLLVPVDNWEAFSEKGGTKGSISFVPVNEIAQVIIHLQNAADRIKDQIYEQTGISDIIRGQSSPYETAAAQNIKAQYASLRLQTKQTEVAEFFAELIRIKAFLILKFYPVEVIIKKAGPLNATDAKIAPQAITMLKDELLANTLIDVSVDSLQLANWQQDKQERNEAVAALATLLQQAIPAVQQNPESGPFFLHLIKFQLSSYRGAREIEGYIDEQLQQLVSGAQQKQETKVDPAEQAAKVAQAQAEAAAQNSQALQKIKSDAEVQMSDNELMFKREQEQNDVDESKAKNQIELAKLRLEELKLQNAGIDTSELHLPVGDGVVSQRLTKDEMLSVLAQQQQQNIQMMGQMMDEFQQVIGQLLNTPAPSAVVHIRRNLDGSLVGSIQ